MTSKERLLNILKKKSVDRVPFCPFLAYWWEAQPDSLTDLGELVVLEKMGADPLFRGHYPMLGKTYDEALLFTQNISDCNINTWTEGNRRFTVYQTSKGALTLGYRYVQESNTWFLVDHPLKEEKDFQLLTYIMQCTTLTPSYDRFLEEEQKLGDRGLIIPVLCPELKSSFQSLVERWAGTEQIVYSLMDYPDTVLETLEAMRKVSCEAAKIAANSPASAFITWEDTSTTNISPSYYREYILPEINQWCEILHRAGKLYVQHACGHLNDLMADIASSPIDCLESISPMPTGNVDIEKVPQQLPSRIAVIGGLEPTDMLNCSIEMLEKKSNRLITAFCGRAYALSNSDSCPPGVDYEKFVRLAKLVKTQEENNL